MTESRITAAFERVAPGRYRSATIDGFRVWFVPEAEPLRPWAIPWKDVRRNPERHPEIPLYKMSSLRTVVRFDGAGLPLVVKRSLLRRFPQRLLAPFRLAKEAEELLLAHRWIAAGWRTPEPLFYAEGHDEQFAVPVRYLALRPLPSGLTEGKALFRRVGFRTPHWEELARFTARQHSAGTLHADYRADHLHFAEAEGPAAMPWQLDLDGSRVLETVSLAARRRVLLRLFQSAATAKLAEEDGARFVAAYDPQHQFRLDGLALARKALARHDSLGHDRSASPR